MAKTYKTPGVYIEEISLLPPSIAAVETAIPAFIGYTEKAEKDNEDLTNVPTKIKSLLEYQQYFGGAEPETGIAVNLNDEYDSSENLISRKIQVPAPSTTSDFLMYYSLQMFFANGGGQCYIISVGSYSDAISKTDLGANGGLSHLEKEDEPTLIVFPDATAITTAANFYGLYEDALKQCNKLQDRFTLIDTFSEAAGFDDGLRNNISLGTDYLKYGAAYYPYLKTTLPYVYEEDDVTITHTVTNPPASYTDYNGQSVADVADNTELYNQIKLELEKLTVTLPPSSAIAGIIARVDSNRGVWKAPANVGVMEVIGPNKKVTSEDQESLNVHTSGKSINVIRSFAGKGTLVWGSRTLAGNDNEWRYVPVRRFFNFAEESIKKGTQWVVFEPNDANTWVRVKAMIENFLIKQWRAGALAGAKPEDAFFVKVGLGETMTSLDILEGRMNIEIGMAVVRPAEFIILKFSHKLQQS